ncbi:MAG: hypothetical protein UU48_C0004G0061 [Candidatus Uhrbacteria bacterium GW2011_GWF2_41_16]|uniref:Uncharacterized protein n=1 Tax=Candidatus Uhrbacteria bacterium GW2011_GWF2_41_16 TaxID=1618997 RepID=A0A0G0VBH2_9BACT|nr:MAG: hypothetical protein UT33_C0016G0026 [Candidatus Peregrinibacteria bacterium GW2011_GWC2_39_14]KKR98268.1 MAG: hypothetical protein UU48_C0004G0061 [Candidatus Uhrbacteria bacterium GW2011_GWF2_41_16]HBP00408.1 hypothetical protein [Candidatus Uhrbacteria bacterium]
MNILSSFLKKIYTATDQFEDKVRSKLSHYPIIYAFVGGAGIIIFWRGVWHTMDEIIGWFSSEEIIDFPWWDGPLSILIGTVLLLTVGLFVSSFIGNEIIISGLKKEKKLIEKMEEEIERERKENEK